MQRPAAAAGMADASQCQCQLAVLVLLAVGCGQDEEGKGGGPHLSRAAAIGPARTAAPKETRHHQSGDAPAGLACSSPHRGHTRLPAPAVSPPRSSAGPCWRPQHPSHETPRPGPASAPLQPPLLRLGGPAQRAMSSWCSSMHLVLELPLQSSTPSSRPLLLLRKFLRSNASHPSAG
jgi:hypothetical protein